MNNQQTSRSLSKSYKLEDIALLALEGVVLDFAVWYQGVPRCLSQTLENQYVHTFSPWLITLVHLTDRKDALGALEGATDFGEVKV